MELEMSKYRITKDYVHVYIELITAARYRGTVTYQEIAQILELPLHGEDTVREVETVLEEISEDEVSKERPMLSAIAVNDQGYPGQSFFNSAKYLNRLKDKNEDVFWNEERQAVYGTWNIKLKDR